MKKSITILGAMLLVSVILTSCGGNDSHESADPAVTTEETTPKLEEATAAEEKALVGTWECRIEYDEASVAASGVKGFTAILVINEDKTCLEKNSLGEFHRTWKTNGSDLCFKTVVEKEEIDACSKYVLNEDVLTMEFEDLKVEYKRIK